MGWIQQLWRRLQGGPKRQAADIQGILDAFQREIGLRFNDQALLRQALTHRSFLGSNGADPRLSNERIEFLGDAVLELAVIEFLYRLYPEDREGALTKKKGLLVSREVLAHCAERMRLGNYILLSDAERDSGGRARASILADTFEAVAGSIHLDHGLVEARRFVRERLLVHADSILKDQSLSNHKSLLQERVQARFKTHPRYRVVTESGPDHMKVFTVEVSIRGMLLGRGQGNNKKEAEQASAQNALFRLGQIEPDLPPAEPAAAHRETPPAGTGGDPSPSP